MRDQLMYYPIDDEIRGRSPHGALEDTPLAITVHRGPTGRYTGDISVTCDLLPDDQPRVTTTFDPERTKPAAGHAREAICGNCVLKLCRPKED